MRRRAVMRAQCDPGRTLEPMHGGHVDSLFSRWQCLCAEWILTFPIAAYPLFRGL